MPQNSNLDPNYISIGVYGPLPWVGLLWRQELFAKSRTRSEPPASWGVFGSGVFVWAHLWYIVSISHWLDPVWYQITMPELQTNLSVQVDKFIRVSIRPGGKLHVPQHSSVLHAACNIYKGKIRYKNQPKSLPNHKWKWSFSKISESLGPEEGQVTSYSHWFSLVQFWVLAGVWMRPPKILQAVSPGIPSLVW